MLKIRGFIMIKIRLTQEVFEKNNKAVAATSSVAGTEKILSEVCHHRGRRGPT